jgi:hypothetical protein
LRLIADCCVNDAEKSVLFARHLTFQAIRMEWSAFTKKHRQPHLIVGQFDPGDKVLRPSRFVILARLVIALEPDGEWGMWRTKSPRRSAIYVAYERLEDAIDLRNAVGAVEAIVLNRRTRWRTRFAFQFDRAASAGIADFTVRKTS